MEKIEEKIWVEVTSLVFKAVYAALNHMGVYIEMDGRVISVFVIYDSRLPGDMNPK